MNKIVIILVLIIMLTACVGQNNIKSNNLMSEIHRNDIAPVVIDDPSNSDADKSVELTDVSLKILQKLNCEKNTLISPLSIASALTMTANGAGSETLVQMEELFGTNISSLNNFLYAYTNYLPDSDKYKVSLANSIWLINDKDLEVKKDFLQKNKDFYNADIYKAAFDESTKKEINNWVKEKTNNQIDKLLDQAPSKDTIMYLINALSFDGEWKNIYQKKQIKKGEFINANGEKQAVDFMHSQENNYISLPNAKGVAKPYVDGKYSFVAILPDENLSMADFIESLGGEMLNKALSNMTNERVITAIPKFEFSYEKTLNDVLISLGMTDAFDDKKADFSNMATYSNGNIYISKVIHKTKIAVDEKGTKAGAVTAVEMEKSAAPILENPKEIILDRPFVFIIVDNTHHLPLFMGILNEVID